MSFHQFDEKARMDKPIECFACIQKGAIHSTAIVDEKVDGLFQTVQRMDCWRILLKAEFVSRGSQRIIEDDLEDVFENLWNDGRDRDFSIVFGICMIPTLVFDDWHYEAGAVMGALIVMDGDILSLDSDKVGWHGKNIPYGI